MLEDSIKHLRLPEARKVYLDHFLNLYGGDRFVVRLLIEAGRFLVYHVALILDAAQDPAQRETWLTIGLLKRTLATYGVASSRHIDELVARLCAVGFMEQRPSDQDRLVRLCPRKKCARMIATGSLPISRRLQFASRSTVMSR